MYRLIPGSLEVISYYKRKSGKKIGMRLTYDGRVGWYELWRNGKGHSVYLKELQDVANEYIKREEIKMSVSSKINGLPVIVRDKYIIGSQHKTTGLLSVTASAPMQHYDLHTAQQEAARLAKVCPEKKFIVFKTEAIASVNEVNWE